MKEILMGGVLRTKYGPGFRAKEGGYEGGGVVVIELVDLYTHSYAHARSTHARIHTHALSLTHALNAYIFDNKTFLVLRAILF